MEVTDTLSLEVSDSSFINEARRQLASFARVHQISDTNLNRIDLIAAELCTNLVKHTPLGGRLLAQGIDVAGERGVEIFSIDQGKGMNVEQCIVDGVSSTGTLGTGLGAIQRLSDEFSIHAEQGKGTAIQIKVWDKQKPGKEKFSIGGLSVPKLGEKLSGDKWHIAFNGKDIYCLLVDGLGHGFEACEAAQLAVRRFKENTANAPTTSQLMQLLHKSLRGSRGAVAAVAKILPSKHKLEYCGLGNIAGVVQTGNSRKHLVSMNGTVGYEASKFMEFSMPWNPESILVMHSDGFSSRTLDSLPEVENESSPLIAGWLYQQHAKDIDDATVLVLKQSGKARGKQ